MNVQTLLESRANITVAVSAADLREFAKSIVEETVSRLEESEVMKRNEVLITKAEAAKQVHRTISALSRWSKSGYLVPVIIGGRPMYKQSDVDKIVNGD